MLVSKGRGKMEDTKQRILEKSLELFSAKGYDAVSVGEIAKAVGIFSYPGAGSCGQSSADLPVFFAR